MKKRIIKISGLFLILLFAFNYASSNFFFHTHIVDGVKISHSHPYKAAPDGTEGHEHSSSELQFFSNILRTLYTNISFISIPLLILTLISIFTHIVNVQYGKVIEAYITPRAPPIF